MYNIIIKKEMIDNFEWDYNKNVKNKKKHNIIFEEAVTVFYDECGILFDDPAHSDEEERFLLLGYSSENNLCIVSHCYRKENTIRIISVRKATKKEQEFYDRFNGGE